MLSIRARIIAIAVCFATGLALIVVWNTQLTFAVGTSLIASSIALVADTISYGLHDESIFSQIANLRRIKLFRSSEQATESVFKYYHDQSLIKRVILIGYTCDMLSRDFQRYIGSSKTKVQELHVIIKHPVTIGEDILLQGQGFPKIPNEEQQSQKRKNEIEHTLNEIQSLFTAGLVQNYKIRGYYCIPSVRAVIINDEYGFFSLYGQHNTAHDMSGHTGAYFQVSKRNKQEKALLEMLQDWFSLTWKLSVVIDES